MQEIALKEITTIKWLKVFSYISSSFIYAFTAYRAAHKCEPIKIPLEHG